ncbi:hypothetical protein EXS71_00580 [Candidatus Uhrbacteria bacterium]|nr:hypothetical protein [Candidatus Uhrbacteria bacterium]
MSSHQPSPLLTQCPLCEGVYPKESIQLVGEQRGLRLFHCTCQTCGHTILAILLESAGWMSSIAMVTDLEVKDALRFQGAIPIATNECVQFHQFLESSSQELCHALLRP